MSDEEASGRAIFIRPRAIEDIERHAEYLEENASPDVALRYRSALMKAVDQIALFPNSGSPRQVKNTLLTGLRMWIVPDFRNYLLFYLTSENEIEIVRVLHGAQDIKNILEEEE
jgi:toxin ParE1/3/4